MNNPGITYGGTFWFPEHPLADMHGQVRIVIRVRSRLQIARPLAALGLEVTPTEWLKHHFAPSASIVEFGVTQEHYQQPMACSLSLAYLDQKHYHLIPRELKHHG